MSAKKNRGKNSEASGASPVPVWNQLAPTAAWFFPGLGHWLLGRRSRGMGFLILVLATLSIGVVLDGNLPWQWSGSPLRTLATLGAMGCGLPYFLLRFGMGFEGEVTAPGYEVGSAFIVTAGLMNMLLILDVWDLSRGLEDED